MAEARKINHKSNWLDLMNNSADSPTLQERFNKANINIDRTTLKLLPILLKALNQNRYVDKIIEEPTSLYPPYERSDTTDVAYTKNIFADTRNWMKMPNSRLYTIEYKTSPIVYFKNPTRNVDYFTKIRKIRDYQRIMNYVDKMISEKNLLGSTQPMKSDLGYTEIPILITKPIRKYKTTQTMVNKQTTTPKVIAQEKKINCKCPHKFGQLMQKLLTSIHHLLSYFSASNANKTVSSCNDSIQTETFNTFDDSTQQRHLLTKNHKVIEPEITKTTPYKNFLNKHKYTLDITPSNNVDKRRDYTIKTIMSLLKPNFNKHSNFETNLDSTYGFSTTNSYVRLSDTNSLTKETSTESILKYLNYANRKIPMDAVTTVADYILQKGVYDISPEIKSSDSTLADTDFTTDDDYYTETTANLSNNFDNLDVHSSELVKKKLIKKNNTIEEKARKYPFKGTRPSQNVYNNINSMRKVGNLVSSNKNNTKPLPTLHRFAPITKPILKLTTTKKSTPVVSTTEPITKTIKSQNKFRYFNIKPTTTNNTKYKDVQSKINHTDNKMELEEDIVEAWQENISKETTLKHIEEEIKRLNNETTTKQTDILTNSDSQWELVKLEESSTSINSMIPLSRPTYLEMQRNDWRHNEIHDYDTNVNNFNYD